MVAVLSNQREIIFEAVRRMYTAVADEPAREFHFPTGRKACEFVGHPTELLDLVPPSAAESFAGVGHPFTADVIRRGDVVIDIGSGSGTDTFLAARLVGPDGCVLGLDMTEAIPLPDASVDVVTTNGVINLVPDKPRAIREIARVLRPGGWLQMADIVVRSLPSEACRSHPEHWAECVVGAATEESYVR